MQSCYCSRGYSGKPTAVTPTEHLSTDVCSELLLLLGLNWPKLRTAEQFQLLQEALRHASNVVY
jgi:hypothetical protein